MSSQAAGYSVYHSTVIPGTNADKIKSIYDGIQTENTKDKLIKIGIGPVNINYLRMFGQSQKQIVAKLKSANYVPKVSTTDNDINLKTKILNDDISGLSIIRVIHSLLMPVHVQDDTSFLIYILNAYNTETKILILFNEICGSIRTQFIADYFNGLSSGKKLPSDVYLNIVNKNNIYKSNNLVIKPFNTGKNKRKGGNFKGKNQNNNNKNSKGEESKAIGKIDANTFKQ